MSIDDVDPDLKARSVPPYEEYRKSLNGDALLFEPEGPELTFKFENRAAASNFLHWLSRLGEQDFWEWMRYRERESPEPGITALRFKYHQPGHGVVTVECGRMDDPEK